MADIADIKGRIEALSPAQQAELLAWLLERDHQSWDASIARDQKAGKFDSLIAEAKADRPAGKARELHHQACESQADQENPKVAPLRGIRAEIYKD